MTKRPLVRVVVPAAWFVGGSALAGAAYAGNMIGLSEGLAIAAIVGAAAIAVVGRSGSDVGAVLRAAGDERQSVLDVRARGIAALLVFLFCAAQAARWYANGHGRLAQPYLIVCIVEIAGYVASLLWLTFKQNAATKNAGT